jgi:hypothetical protein
VRPDPERQQTDRAHRGLRLDHEGAVASNGRLLIRDPRSGSRGHLTRCLSGSREALPSGHPREGPPERAAMGRPSGRAGRAQAADRRGGARRLAATPERSPPNHPAAPGVDSGDDRVACAATARGDRDASTRRGPAHAVATPDPRRVTLTSPSERMLRRSIRRSLAPRAVEPRSGAPWPRHRLRAASQPAVRPRRGVHPLAPGVTYPLLRGPVGSRSRAVGEKTHGPRLGHSVKRLFSSHTRSCRFAREAAPSPAAGPLPLWTKSKSLARRDRCFRKWHEAALRH